MGLAPYGKPTFIDVTRKIVRLQRDGSCRLDLSYFRHHTEWIAYQWADGSPEFGNLFAPSLEELLGPVRRADDPLDDRHRDIARSVQAMYDILSMVHHATRLVDILQAHHRIGRGM